jgi:hypothetical protein
LVKLRRQKAEERDRELRKVKEFRELVTKAVAEAPAAIPEKVAMRMGQRMLPLVGGPLFLGLGSFVAFWYLATYKNMEFEPLTVAVSTIGLLVVGLFGLHILSFPPLGTKIEKEICLVWRRQSAI